MPFADKAPTQLTEADLIDLIGAEPEGKSIDYKRDSVGTTDADRKEFLYDASSFANTQGGYLVFGMDEANGLPSNLVGISNSDLDKEILRLEQMLRAGIRPAIAVATAAVTLASGRAAIVMRIPKSWNPPTRSLSKTSFASTRATATVSTRSTSMSFAPSFLFPLRWLKRSATSASSGQPGSKVEIHR